MTRALTRAATALVVLLGLAAGALGQPGGGEPPRMNDGTQVEVPRHHDDTPPPTADRRPYFVGIGVIVLGAIFLWNRRRRAELERQSEEETRRTRAAQRASRAAAPPSDDATAPEDPDAADLRDAAIGSDQEPT